MNFDPAIAAQVAFQEALQSGELGSDSDSAVEAEETFSSSAGAGARSAYETLMSLGQTRPDARHFQEFLIYITWQQVTEETIPAHFQTGLKLSNQYLARFGELSDGRERHVEQIRALRSSYRAGLGEHDEDDHQEEYDRDAFKGGD
jgi:hypothetical protein